MAQVSNFADEDPKLTEPSEQPVEGKTSSLLSKVKDTAKGTVRKLKNKVKKGSEESPEDRSGSHDGDYSEEQGVEAKSESKEGVQTIRPDEVKEQQNGSQRKVSFDGEQQDDLLNPFARSGSDVNSPLIATPTSYSELTTSVEDVMPPSVIEPTSVSDVGEESSLNLGNIPEAKDEEKAAAKEVSEGGPDSDINEGFKDTFQQKDLQAIDGLPKPRGFDDDNENSVRSNDLSYGSQDLENVTPYETASQETEGNAEVSYKGVEREFPVDGSTAGIEQDKEQQHPPGTMAEFSDSMFHSAAIQDLKPNEPNAAEAKHASEIGTYSKDFDPETNGPSGKEGQQQHPPGSAAEFNDSMFSSGALHDLKPNEPNAAEPKHANEVGTFSRDFDPEANKSSGTDGDTDNLQRPSVADSELHENMLSSDIASDLKPSQMDERSSTSANSNAGAPIDGLSREPESEGTTFFHDAPKDLPPPALSSDRMEDSKKSDGSSAGVDHMPSDRDNMRTAAEEEAEDYFDALSDEEVLASQRSLDSDIGKDFNPEATNEINEQRDSSKESAST